MVEDPFICGYVRNVLARRGYQFLQRERQEAVKMLEGSERKVGLLITNRPELFLVFADRVPLLYLAAFPNLELASCFRACRTLQKPFFPEQLVEAVEGLAGSI